MTNKYVKCTTCDALLAHHLPKTTTAESVTERASKCKPTVRLGAAPVPGKKCTIFHNCRVECIKFPRDASHQLNKYYALRTARGGHEQVHYFNICSLF